MKTHVVTVLLVSFVLLTLLLAPLAFSAEPVQTPENYDPDLYHLGEDGQLCLIRPWEDKTGWQAGKIHPDLVALSPGEGELRVKIQLTNQPLSKIAKLAKDSRQGDLDLLNTEIRNMVTQTTLVGTYQTRDQEVEATEYIKIQQKQLDSMKVFHQDIEQVQGEISEAITINVSDAVALDQQTVIDYCKQLGAVITAKSVHSNNIGVRFDDWDSSTLTDLAKNNLIESISPDTLLTLDLNQSECMLGVDSFWNSTPTAYDGGVWDLGLCDSGVRDDNIYLNTHSIYKRYPAEVGFHGTGTAGIVASTHATYKGMAFGLDKIINGAGHNSMSESECFGNQDWVIDATQHGSDGPEVINNSYSLYGHTDEYGSFERYMDSIVDDLNISVTKSAGNRGPGYAGTEQLGYPQSHNLISVANLDIKNTCSTSDDIITHEYSSRGPTDSGRRKPDITAPGTGTYTTGPDSTTDMQILGGTSSAAPHVAGGCLLLRDAGVVSAMAQKAILINTATTWTDGATLSDYTDDGPVAGDRWDDTYGWGILDLGHAYTHRADYFSSSVIARNNNATDDDYKLFKGHMYTNDKVTMNWHRRAVFNDDQAPVTYYTLADLNLRLYDESDGDDLDDDIISNNENVHQVSANGSYDVVVKAYAWSTSIDGLTSEPFVLATEENFQTASPPEFYSNYSRPNYVGPSQTFDITARTFNDGEVTAHDITFTLSDIANITVNVNNTRTLPSIPPDPTRANPEEIIYSLTTSGATAGTHWLPLNITSNCYDETYTFDRANGVSIIVDATPPIATCTTLQYTNSTPIAVNWQASDTQTGVKNTYLYVKGPGQGSYSFASMYDSGTSGVFNYTPTLGEGIYYFAVRSIDNGGTWEAYPTSPDDSTIYDTTAPTSTVSSPAADAGGSIALTYAASDPYPASGINTVYFYYKKGTAGSWQHLTGMNQTSANGVIYYTPTTGPGTYYFGCKAKDNAGNYQYGGYPDPPTTRTIYANPCPGDCTGDGSTNFDDLEALAQGWLESGCTYPLYCDGCDLDTNGEIDLVDFAKVASGWLCVP